MLRAALFLFTVPLTWAIIGGREILPPFRFPWLVSLSCASNEHCCAGILLGSEWVLTAAHCASHCPLQRLRVQLHRHDLNKSALEEGGRVRAVVQRIEHPQWSRGSLVHDIALLRLEADGVSRRIQNQRSTQKSILNLFKDTANSVILAQPRATHTQTMATVAGWGATQEWGCNSGVLLHVEIPILPESQCLAVYGSSLFREGMLCAGGLRLRDACTGDSGGPLFVQQGSSVLLIGLVSWGFRCGAERMPGIYTSIGKHYNWIQKEVGAPAPIN